MTVRTSVLVWAVLAVALLASLPADAARKPLRLRETCVTRAERTHVLRFKAADGVRLIGVELGSGSRTVILAHQGAGGPLYLCSWVPYGRMLAARGYRVLVFDHRGFGSSGRATKSTREDRVDYDVIGAIRTMRARGATSIVLGGGSLGGAAVLSAAALAVPRVDGVFSLSTPTTYERINVLARVRSLTVPVLFAAEEEDMPFPDDARTMFEACRSSDKQLAIFPGVDHGALVLRNPQAQAMVDDFVARHSR
jgi:pimeloyl-ACP methyl ester carboxylesterase